MGSLPPPDFAKAILDSRNIEFEEPFWRIYLARHPDPLGFGKAPSRFSDPRSLPDPQRFGVLYLGSSLKVSFLEAVLRDRRDGTFGDLPLEQAEIDQRAVALITPRRILRLLDLTGDNPVRMGIPSDVVRGSNHDLARQWSVAFHSHPDCIDGILYPSRLNGQHNLAVYERAVSSLDSLGTCPLERAKGFGEVLDQMKVALI